MEKSKIIFGSNIKDFLKSISIFNDRVIFYKKDNDLIATVANNECVFRGIYKHVQFENIQSEDFHLNIPDIRKLIKFIDLIPDDNISLEYNDNHLKYISKQLKLKYFLLDDGIINECKLNIDKALTLQYDIDFDLDKTSIDKIIKLHSNNNNVTKLYLYTRDNCLYCDIADKLLVNTDEISICLKENINFNLEELIIPIEVIRALNTTNFDSLKMQINISMAITLVTNEQKDYKIYYIISGLEK